ncbi:MAG: ADP-ribosylglycohydrolase family protein, partial [Chloroflexota bacterium]
HIERLQRARISLEGLSVGDALGGFFEFQTTGALLAVARIAPRARPWHYTDDTCMALSIYENLRLHERIDPDALGKSFGDHYERGRGYGASMHMVLPRLAKGADWRTYNKTLFPGGSFGNGGPMKIAPLGAYYADDVPMLIEETERATIVSHAHPESVAGSIAVAVAAAHAWNTRNSASPEPEAFMAHVLAHTPASEVHDGIATAQKLTLETPFDKVVTILGNGRRISSMDSVPFAIWCAAHHLRNYEDAIWTTITAGGDVDTLCAMVGGIVACAVGVEAIPQMWREAREPLPEWATGERPS